MSDPTTIDEYLAGVEPGKRAALQRLREIIADAAPEAVETISYKIPTFKQDGLLVAFGAGKNHCALYAMGPAVQAAHADQLKGYKTSAGTIRFQPDAPLPDRLVRSLVAARIDENAAIVAARAAKRRKA